MRLATSVLGQVITVKNKILEIKRSSQFYKKMKYFYVLWNWPHDNIEDLSWALTIYLYIGNCKRVVFSMK